jgi:hypothetical protein
MKTYGTPLSSHNKGRYITISIGFASQVMMAISATERFSVFLTSFAPLRNCCFTSACETNSMITAVRGYSPAGKPSEKCPAEVLRAYGHWVRVIQIQNHCHNHDNLDFLGGRQILALSFHIEEVYGRIQNSCRRIP